MAGVLKIYDGSSWVDLPLVGHTHVEADITDLGNYLENVVEDLTPQLGGNLDTNSKHLQQQADLDILNSGGTAGIRFKNQGTIGGRIEFTPKPSFGNAVIECTAGILEINCPGSGGRIISDVVGQFDSIRADGDGGGLGGATTVTNATQTVDGIRINVFRVSGTATTHVGYIKGYVGTTVVYIPYMTI